MTSMRAFDLERALAEWPEAWLAAANVILALPRGNPRALEVTFDLADEHEVFLQSACFPPSVLAQERRVRDCFAVEPVRRTRIDFGDDPTIVQHFRFVADSAPIAAPGFSLVHTRGVITPLPDSAGNSTNLRERDLRRDEGALPLSWYRTFGERNADAVLRRRVREYYDRYSNDIVASVGTTYQSGLVADASSPHPDTDSNLALAMRSGLRAGQRILDAGCGVCGPACDIASAYPDVRVDGVTVSVVQAQTARQLIAERGLQDRVRALVADYEALPYPSSHFDGVLFFESTGYAASLEMLFAEAARVLRPGGWLYIKDVVRTSHTQEEELEVAEFDRTFAVRHTWRAVELRAALRSAGFADVQVRMLDAQISGARFRAAMLDGGSRLSAFGRRHWRTFRNLRIGFAELRATAP